MNLKIHILKSALILGLIGFSNFAVAEICKETYVILNADIDNYQGEMCDRCYISAKGKASGSEQKANIGKISDAIKKLDELNTNLDEWINNNKPKITQAAHDTLASDIGSVISCLNTVHP